jgi:hypothetical protein
MLSENPSILKLPLLHTLSASSHPADTLFGVFRQGISIHNMANQTLTQEMKEK